MTPSSLSLEAAFLALSAHPRVGAAICRAAATGRFTSGTRLRTLCAELGISQGQSYQVQQVVEAGVEAGLFQQVTGLSWAPVAEVDYETLGAWLQGAALYRDKVSTPRDTVSVVLTQPASPSLLEQVLTDMGHRSLMFEDTGEVFANIASQATKRLMVLTPFIDAQGAQALVKLFGAAAPEVRKELIFRGAEGVPPKELFNVLDTLRTNGVQLFNYWVPKEQQGLYETFHAKVVLADENRCYVGSANMTNASFSFSVELGFLVEGAAARTVSWVCDAIRGVAQ